MFEYDQQIVDKLLEESDEFRSLYEKHQELNKQVDDADVGDGAHGSGLRNGWGLGEGRRGVSPGRPRQQPPARAGARGRAQRKTPTRPRRKRGGPVRLDEI